MDGRGLGERIIWRRFIHSNFSALPSPLPSMASYVHIRTVSPRTVIPLSTPISKPSKHPNSTTITVPLNSSQSGCRTLSPFNSVERGRFATLSMTAGNARELDVLPVHSEDCTDQQDGAMTMRIDRESEETELMGQKMVGGFEGRLSLDGLVGATDSGTMVGLSGGNSGGGGGGKREDGEDLDKLIDRAINAAIVLGVGSFAVTKLLTVDSDYWHGWTVYEILRYAPQHNWSAYEEALKTNPVLAKMVISGIVYSLGDWIAQCVEGKPLFEFDRARMMRSGFVGFSLHGSLSHYYYEFCESLFPFHDWWVVPAKVVIDQTAWTAVWNSIYYMVVGMLRFESPLSVFGELRATFWPMLTAGWKLWPFAHLVTYGLVPLQQRLLWVDCVELIWVTILSTFSNEKSQARIAETSTETNLTSSTTSLPREPEV